MRQLVGVWFFVSLVCSGCTDDLSRDKALRILQQRFSESSISTVNGQVILSTWDSGSIFHNGPGGPLVEGCYKCLVDRVDALLNSDRDIDPSEVSSLNREMNLSFRFSQLAHLRRLYKLGLVQNFKVTYPRLIVQTILKPEYSKICPERSYGFKAGETSCIFLAGTQVFDQITGIKDINVGGNSYYRVEFTTHIALNATANEWCDSSDSKRGPENHIALFTHYDDGWRIAEWDVAKDLLIYCSTGGDKN